MPTLKLIPTLFLLLCACSAQTDTPAAEDDATTVIPEVTPSTESWYEITTDTFEVASGEERFLCYAFDLEEDLTIDTWAFESRPVVHHLIVAETFGDEPDGLSECDVLFRPTWFPIFIAGTGDTHVPAPEGAGYVLNKGKRILVQLHLLNTSPEDIEEAITLKLRRTDKEDLEPIGMMVFGSMALALPPREASDVVDTCEMSDDVEIFTVFPHMHYLGTSLVVEHATADGELIEIYRRDPYSFDDQRMEPLALTVGTGDQVRVTCTYNNTTDDVITFGESTNNEMCFFIAYTTGNDGRLDTCMGGGGDSTNASGYFPEGCGTDEANDIGIGATCSAEGGECAEDLACTHDLLGPVGPGICISMNACESSEDCGGGGAICCAPPQTGGTINICLPPSCQSPACPEKI